MSDPGHRPWVSGRVVVSGFGRGWLLDQAADFAAFKKYLPRCPQPESRCPQRPTTRPIDSLGVRKPITKGAGRCGHRDSGCQGGNPPFCSAPLRKINSKKISRCARNNGRIARKYPPKREITPKNATSPPKKAKTPQKNAKNTPKNAKETQTIFFALTREKLTHRTKKI